MLAWFTGIEHLEIVELGKGYKAAPKTAADILTDDPNFVSARVKSHSRHSALCYGEE